MAWKPAVLRGVHSLCCPVRFLENKVSSAEALDLGRLMGSGVFCCQTTGEWILIFVEQHWQNPN